MDPNTIARFERLIVRHLAGEALDALANDAQVMRADLRAAADAYRAGARAALAGFLASKLGANN